MAITGVCPACGSKFQAPDKLSGRSVKCPKCSARIEVAPEKSNAGDGTRWYVQTGEGRQHGPVTKEKLDALVAAGRLDGFCRLRPPGSNRWQWAEDVYPELAAGTEPEPRDESHQPAADPLKPPRTARRLVRCPDCDNTAYAREVSAAAAQRVDNYYRQAHMATSLISSTKETSKMLQSLAKGNLDAIPESGSLPSEDESGSLPSEDSYASQYDSLHQECFAYLSEKIETDDPSLETIKKLAEQWAADKQAAFDKELEKQLGLVQ